MRICEQIADGLHETGHEVAVLTSHYQDGPEVKRYPVYRQLHIDPDWTLKKPAMWRFFVGRRAREAQDVAALQQLLTEFEPDVIFVWHANGLSRLMLQMAEQAKQTKTVYYFANYFPEIPDEYMQYWQAQGSNLVVRLVKGIIAPLALTILKQEGKPIPLQFAHSISVSHYVRDRLQSRIGADAVVIPNGIDLETFGAQVKGLPSDGILQCVIAGRVAPEKGIKTVLLALAQLKQKDVLQSLHLTIIGDGPVDYKASLREIVTTHQLHPFVTFQLPVPIEQMPTIYAAHHILLLPSEWHEPLSCTMLEAMAAGLLVVGTTTGGSGEALKHQQTGLVFAPGDPTALAEQLETILHNPTLVPQLAQAGQQTVTTGFDMTSKVYDTEQYLLGLMGRAKL